MVHLFSCISILDLYSEISYRHVEFVTLEGCIYFIHYYFHHYHKATNFFSFLPLEIISGENEQKQISSLHT